MEITIKNNHRTLTKTDGTEVPVEDGDYVKYTALYYNNPNDIYSLNSLETAFVGIIHRCRYRYDTGITGIYIKPLYIFIDGEWNRIVNLNPPKTKYFLYPHLLMIPPHSFSQCYALEYLHTCEPVSLADYTHITREFDLGYFWN